MSGTGANPYADGEQVIAEVARQTDTILLSFSCGKDSLATWLAVRGRFRRVVPFYLYHVPGLGFVERSLAYYERRFGAKIIRVAAPWLVGWLNGCIFQPPERVPTIERADMARYTFEDVRRELCRDLGLPLDTWCAAGWKASDSMNRRTLIHKLSPIREKDRIFYPIFDWRKADVLTAIRAAGVKLPVDYRMWRRSFDGIHFALLGPLREAFPEDYERILQWFPLAEMEFLRWRNATGRR
jgi:hypothetical protein